MNFLKLILSPFSIIYWMITSVRNTLFKVGLLKIYKSKLPVISVGNLSLGGTGKTPHIAYLASLFSKHNTVVISRGYGRKGNELIVGDSTIHTAKNLGDEPMELLSKFEGDNFKMLVDGNRARALQYLECNYPNTDIVLLDDGFQHQYANRNLNILLSDYSKLFYKDYIIPLGTLRESRKGAKRADAIIITKCPSVLNEKQKKEIKYRVYKYSTAPVYFSKIEYKKIKNDGNAEINTTKNYLLITGIAEPEPIYDYLSNQSINFEKITFSDHHNFSDYEIEKIGKKSQLFDGIITTEKDWMRLKETKLQTLTQKDIFRINIAITFLDKEDETRFNQQAQTTLNI
jgi:tetraacyldisaccharide 4'-kinase